MTKPLHALRYAASRLTCERTTYCGMKGRPRSTYTFDMVDRVATFKAIRPEDSSIGITCKRCVRAMTSRKPQKVARAQRAPKVLPLDEFDQWAYG